MSGADRNQPCPCGSGQKYKRCCLRRQQAAEATARREAGARQRLLDLESETTAKIRGFALDAFDVDPFEQLPFPIDEPREALGMFVPFTCYDLGPFEAMTWARALLADGGWVTDEEQRWLEAQAACWVGVWEARSIDRGRSMTMRDRLTGEVRTVFERSASRTLPVQGCLVGRVVDFDGRSVLSGTYPVPLSPRDADLVVEHLRRAFTATARLPKRRLLKPAELRTGRIRLTTVLAVHKWAEARAQRPAPILQNTDGDPLEQVEERYPFDPDARAAVDAGVRRLADAVCVSEPGERPTHVQIERPGHAQSKALPNTITAHLFVHADALVVQTNARRRADTIAAAIATLDLPLGASTRTVEPIELPTEPVTRPGPRLEAAPPPALIEQVQAFNEAHYTQWVDDPLPALDGKSPRQAVRTKSGRAQVESLLRDLAWHQQRMPEWQRVDVDVIAARLRLPPLSAVDPPPGEQRAGRRTERPR